MPSSHSASRPLRPPRNLTSELARRLGDEIVAGKLAPRTRLPTEHALMETFGVSRTVVREAIAALRAEGLVETRQGSGAFVAADPRRRPFRIDPEGLRSIPQVLDVMELRICVEVEAAGLAAGRRTGPTSRGSTRSGAPSPPRWPRRRRGRARFRLPCRDRRGDRQSLFLGLPRFHRQHHHPAADDPGRRERAGEARGPISRRVREEHDAIAEAIAAGTAKAASVAMRVHLTRGRDRYRRLMAAEKGPARQRKRG